MTVSCNAYYVMLCYGMLRYIRFEMDSDVRNGFK